MKLNFVRVIAEVINHKTEGSQHISCKAKTERGLLGRVRSLSIKMKRMSNQQRTLVRKMPLQKKTEGLAGVHSQVQLRPVKGAQMFLMPSGTKLSAVILASTFASS